MANTTIKTTTAKTAVTPPTTTKPHWKKDGSKSIRWVVYHVPGCTYIEKVRKLFTDHGEEGVQITTFSEGAAQTALTHGHNFSPAIFINGKLLGSVGDLENYYRRNYFSNIREAMEE